MKPKTLKNALVEKRNVLNELRDNELTLQQLRFFSIYLAKINARDESTRVVRFTLSDFQRIMELGRINTAYLKTVTNSLLCKVINVMDDDGRGYTGFTLFKKCRVREEEHEEAYVEIDANDEALPLLFKYKNRYFTYELWNALRLRSKNQLRMYEILKQYEKVGERVLYINDLKELLGLKTTDYPRYDNFKRCVLDVCQTALAENTDIQFTYEPTGKRGKGGKIGALKFTITKNDKYVDPLSLSDFIDIQAEKEAHEGPKQDGPLVVVPSADAEQSAWEADVQEDEGSGFMSEQLEFIAEACKMEFNEREMQILYNLLVQIIPYRHDRIGTEMYDHLKRRYDELNWQAGRREITFRFGYLKKILEADVPNGK